MVRLVCVLNRIEQSDLAKCLDPYLLLLWGGETDQRTTIDGQCSTPSAGCQQALITSPCCSARVLECQRPSSLSSGAVQIIAVVDRSNVTG